MCIQPMHDLYMSFLKILELLPVLTLVLLRGLILLKRNLHLLRHKMISFATVSISAVQSWH